MAIRQPAAVTTAQEAARALTDSAEAYRRRLALLDPRTYAPSYIQAETRQLQAIAKQDALSSAHRGYQELRKARAEAATQRAKLRTKADDKINWQRLSALTGEYAAILAAPNVRAKPTQVLAALVNEAEQAGDVHRLRALRSAGAPIVAAASTSTADYWERDLAHDLRKHFADAERNELGGQELDELAEREAALKKSEDELLATVRQTQRMLDPEGASRALYGELHHGWDYQLANPDAPTGGMFDATGAGGGVVFHSDAEAAAATQGG